MNIRRLVVRTLSVAASLALIAPAPEAQTRSSTSKFFLTAGVNGTSIDTEDPIESKGGPGIHLGGGYGFTPRFAVFLDFAGASLKSGEDDYILSHVDLGARFHFGDRTKAFVPYIEGAFTGRSAALDDQNVDGNDDIDVELSGGALTVGGGLLYFFNPKWAFNAHLKWTKGEFSRIRVENVTVDGLDFDATTVRVGVGLTWFPSGNR